MNDFQRIVETMKLDLNLLRSSEGAIADLARSAHLVDYERGTYVFMAGDASDFVYLVENGKVILSKEAPSGKRFTVLIAVRGMVLNGVTCFMARPRFFSARVVEQATVVAIPSGIFRQWVLNHPQVTAGILDTVGNLLDSSYTRVLDLIDQNAETRIINALNMLSRRLGSILPLTNEDMAEMTGVSRETAARIISHLHGLKIVHKSRRSIKVLDEAALQDLGTCPFFIL